MYNGNGLGDGHKHYYYWIGEWGRFHMLISSPTAKYQKLSPRYTCSCSRRYLNSTKQVISVTRTRIAICSNPMLQLNLSHMRETTKPAAICARTHLRKPAWRNGHWTHPLTPTRIYTRLEEDGVAIFTFSSSEWDSTPSALPAQLRQSGRLTQKCTFCKDELLLFSSLCSSLSVY